jgi:hypothetical protein
MRCCGAQHTSVEGETAMMGLRWLLAMLCLCLCQVPLWAQNDASYCNSRRFTIPFSVDSKDAARIREAQLYESVDGRSNWHLVAKIGPNENKFLVNVSRDGEYWYLLRLLDDSNQFYPAQLDRLPADVQITKVIVDTAPPRITFRELPTKGDQVGVTWTVQDENLDLNSLRLDILSPSGQWTPINIGQRASGEAYFTPRTRGRIDCRLSVQDLARNQDVKSLSILPSATTNSDRAYQDQGSRDPNYNDDYAARRSQPSSESTASTGREPRYVNKEKFFINFDLEDVGPSGAYVEAFYLADNTWTPCGQTKVQGVGAGKVEVTLPRDGNFGLITMVRSGFDNVSQKPRPSTTPDLWVCIDKTPPKVANVQVTPGRGSNIGMVNITWMASDVNLASRPIRLEYRDVDDPDKSWRLIEDNLDNTGRYAWQAPRTGYKFEIRVSAFDKARNVGEGTSAPVVVDVAQPKIRILDIEH